MKPIPQPRRPDPQAIAAMKQPVDDPVVAGITARPSQTFTASSQLTKLTVRLDRNLLGRVRAAFVAEGLPSGHTSLSAWVAAVLEDRVVQVEASCNHGHQFAPLGVDTIPKGRLCGSSPVTDGQHIECGGESDEQ
jgi:hypothetical protein